jgi:hypothetical protein
MNEMKQAYAQAQDDAQRAGQFTPYNVYAGTGSTSYDPATGSMRSSLDPAYQGLRTSLLGNAQGGLNALSTYDPNAMATQTYNQMQAMAAPGEAADRANLTAQIQQTGQTGLEMGGDPNNPDPAMQAAYNPQMAALLRSQSQASQARQLSAINQSQDIANQMQARATGQLGAGFQLDQSQLANMQLGGQLGSQAMQGRLAGSRLAQPAIIGQGAAKAGLLGGIGSSLGLPGMGGAGGGIPGMGGALGSGLSNMFGGGGINLGNLWRSNPGSGTIPGSMQDINSNYDNYLYGDPSLNYGGGVGYGTTPMLPDYTGGGTFGGDISGGVGDFGSSNFIPGMGGGSDFGGGGFTDFAAGPYTF